MYKRRLKNKKFRMKSNLKFNKIGMSTKVIDLNLINSSNDNLIMIYLWFFSLNILLKKVLK